MGGKNNIVPLSLIIPLQNFCEDCHYEIPFEIFYTQHELTIQVVGRVERVQTLLAPLHEAILLALVDRLEQLEQFLLLLRHLLVGAATHRVTVDKTDHARKPEGVMSRLWKCIKASGVLHLCLFWSVEG